MEDATPLHEGAEFDDIAKLEDNWDGYGAIPIHADAIEHARTIHAGLIRDGHLVDVCPNTNGTITLEWAWKFRTYTLEVGTTLMSGCIKRHDRNADQQ